MLEKKIGENKIRRLVVWSDELVPGISQTTLDVVEDSKFDNAQVFVTGLVHSSVSQSFEKKIYGKNRIHSAWTVKFLSNLVSFRPSFIYKMVDN